MYIASSGLGPRNAEAAEFEPIWVAWNAVPGSRRPSTRSIQPVRSELPGAARSISSIASKCERFGSSMPTACTTPNVSGVPERLQRRHRGMHPELGSSWISWPGGIAMFGRRFA